MPAAPQPRFSKEEVTSTIFAPVPEYNLLYVKMASGSGPSHAPLPTHVLHLGLFPFSYCLTRTTFASAPFRRAIKLWAKMAERSFIHAAIFIIFLLSSSVRKLKIGHITVEKICCGVTLRSRA